MRNPSGESEVWYLVPARGGSKGVPRKNVRHLAGRPLIHHVLGTLGTVAERDRLLVSTDDEEVKNLVASHARFLPRPAALASDAATLDEVALDVAQRLLEEGASPEDFLVTVQPTSPLLRRESLGRAVELLRAGARCVVSVRDDRHLRWTQQNGKARPLFEARVNRQWLPPTFTETGGVIAVRLGDLVATGTRIQEEVALLELDGTEGLDIDSHADWTLAEFYLSRKRIVIRADAAPSLGMGHVHRALALAYEFADHQPLLVSRTDGGYALGADFLAAYPFSLARLSRAEDFVGVLQEHRPDIVVLDVLDTETSLVRQVKANAGFVVSFEDLGPGARVADIVINDLYTDLYPQSNHWYGVQHAVLAPSFESVRPVEACRSEVERVLITFGGTDPACLTVKAVEALSAAGYEGETVVVLGPGYSHVPINLDEYGLQGEILQSVPNMAQVMREADIALTSGGRTVTELMTLGIPTIVMCQNPRELRHTHASSPFGVINLGLGRHVEVAALADYVQMLLKDQPLRADMRARALAAVRGRSNRAITQRILVAATSSTAPTTDAL